MARIKSTWLIAATFISASLSTYPTTAGTLPRAAMTTTTASIEVRAQPGPQEAFLSSPADIAIYGGAAGGGKTYALLMEPLRHITRPGFGATIFRRRLTQITLEGGLWETSEELYPHVGGRSIQNPHRWTFPSGAKIEFHHLQLESDRLNWQGSQLAFIGFDELTHFTERQFWYLFGRNRSTCGVRPYIRATTNPEPDTWVKKLIRWWLDEDGRFADPDKAGRLRWFLRVNDELEWFDSSEAARFYADGLGMPELEPISVTFIPSYVYDNKILLREDPSYLAKLQGLPRIERERLLGGDWKIRATAGTIFNRDMFPIVEAAPVPDRVARCWDRAASEPSAAYPDPDYTAGVKMQRNGELFTITDARRFRVGPGAVQARIHSAATWDGRECSIVLYQDPAAAGKFEVHQYYKLLAGYSITTIVETQRKYLKWQPFAAQAEHGNVRLVRGPWNDPLINELENLSEDPKEYAHDDWGDAASGAFEFLTTSIQWGPA